MTKTPLRRSRIRTCTRARIKQGTKRARFSSMAEWDVRLFVHSLCQTTEPQNVCEKQGSLAKRNQKGQYVSLFSMKHFVGD